MRVEVSFVHSIDSVCGNLLQQIPAQISRTPSPPSAHHFFSNSIICFHAENPLFLPFRIIKPLNMKAKLAVFSLLVLFLAGCKDKTEFPQPVFANSYLHIVSGATVVDTFSMVFDYYNVSDVVISNYYLMKNWPMQGYAELTAGGVPDEFGNGKIYLHAIKYHSPTWDLNDTLFQYKDILLSKDERSTLCFTDSSGNLIALKYTDDYDQDPDSGFANVRFINLKENVATASLTSTNGAVNVPGVNFRSASSFIRVPTGVYTMEARDDSNNNLIGNIGSITIWNKGTFTFYIAANGTLSQFLN